MVVCPNCYEENNDAEYCSVCGTKLVENQDSSPAFSPSLEIKEISKINEVNDYLNHINERVKKQENLLKELKTDPMFDKYESISQLEKENEELKKQIELDEVTINNLNNEKDELSLKVQGFDNQKAEFFKRIAELESDNSSLNFKNNSLSNEIQDLNSRIRQLQNEVGDLRNQLNNSSGSIIGGFFNGLKKRSYGAGQSTSSQHSGNSKFCPHCGCSVDKTSNFCINCGKRL